MVQSSVVVGACKSGLGKRSNLLSDEAKDDVQQVSRSVHNNGGPS